jgi:hypothetical protein
MSQLSLIGAIPGVRSVVLGDRTGVLLDALREADGESTAAVSGFLATALAEAGSHLGLGELSRLSLAGASRACVVAVSGDALVTARVEPASALPGVEKAFETTLGGQG